MYIYMHRCIYIDICTITLLLKFPPAYMRTQANCVYIYVSVYLFIGGVREIKYVCTCEPMSAYVCVYVYVCSHIQ